jgi:hypothetical protein
MSRLPLRLLLVLLLALGLVLAAACEEDPAETRTTEADPRAEARQVLETLRTELNRDAGNVVPERKEALLQRCVNALERLVAAEDERAGLVDDFCDSLEDTNPNTPAAWDDIRARLNELIDRLSER